MKRIPDGFGIIEVLVAIALVAIMSVGISSLLMNTMKSQKGIQAKDQQREVTADIRTFLNNKTACLNSFVGRNPEADGFAVGSIKDALGVDRYVLNTPDRSGMLKYTEFKVEKWVQDAVVPTQGTAELKIYLSKVGDTGSSKEIRPDLITLKVKRDALGNISECFSIGTQSDGLWQVSPGNNSDAYYNNGNIGIGVQNPVAKLEIAGELKVANSNSLCTAANEGSLRYNNNDPLNKMMEFCDGANWKPMGGAAAGGGGAEGTMCGSSRTHANSVSECQGHNPLFSCPQGYTSWSIGWRGEGFNTCVKQ